MYSSPRVLCSGVNRGGPRAHEGCTTWVPRGQKRGWSTCRVINVSHRYRLARVACGAGRFHVDTKYRVERVMCGVYHVCYRVEGVGGGGQGVVNISIYRLHVNQADMPAGAGAAPHPESELQVALATHEIHIY
jgi:hypothetical protein